MTHAIIVEEAGGPEVMQWQEINLEAPGPGQALVRQTVVGLNFIDIYQRSGKYPVKFPSSIGMEAAGVVEAVGADHEREPGTLPLTSRVTTAARATL